MSAPRRRRALLEGLNEPQREAVLHGEGPLLILAGAGSGKTRVLTHRIAHLVRTGQARPGEILAITFTNKAAQEMRERVEALGRPRVRAMWVMTFHSACARMLRADAERLGYTRGFTIYDEQDSLRLVKNCVDELDVDPKRFAPRASGARSPTRRTSCSTPRPTARRCRASSSRPPPTSTSSTSSGSTRPTRWTSTTCCSAASTCSSCSPRCASATAAAFRHVLVDEYQDTNRAQYRWLQLLCEEHRNLCVVGDDDQSVYAFRGADIRNILDFEDDFPDAEVVKLEQNYRSTQTILDAANAVIANNRARKEKSLWTELGEGDPVHVRELEDEHAEARFVVAEIERLVDEGDSRDEIAVFYRTNAQSRVLEDKLVRYGVGYQVIGGTRFYERAEIKDALGLPHAARQPRRHGGLRARGQLAPARHRRHLPGADHGLREHARRAGLGRRRRAREGPGLGAAAVKAVGRFMSVMERPARARGRRRRRGDLLAETLEETGYTDALARRADGRGAGAAREPRGARGGGARVRRHGRGGLGRGVPPADRALLGAGQPARRAGLRHPDDPAQRQGPRVRHRLHHRARGRRVPAHALDRGGRPRGGAPSSPTWASRAPSASSTSPTPARGALFGNRDWNLRSRFIDEIPVELTDRDEEEPTRPAAGAAAPAWGGGAAAPAEPAGAGASFALGDDVVHAQFGEGVVRGVEPGGLVVVRFAATGRSAS